MYGEVVGKVEGVGEEDASFLEEDTSIAQEYAVTEQCPVENLRSCLTAESRLGEREDGRLAGMRATSQLPAST